jgi:hypothetical protein
MENDLFNQLLAIGKTGDFSQISSLTGAGSWDEVIKITPHGNGIDSFCKQLPEDEKIAFIKAVAAYENTVGPFGSVTSLVRLLPLIEDNEAVFDWVLKIQIATSTTPMDQNHSRSTTTSKSRNKKDVFRA